MRRDRGLTMVELMITIMLGAIVMLSASAILIVFTKTGAYLKKRIDYDRAWVVANEHLKKHIHSSSYLKINNDGSLTLYDYNSNPTGTYSTGANGGLYFNTDNVTFEGVTATFVEKATTKNKTTEIQVNYIAPFSNTLFLKCNAGMPNTWAVVIGSSTNDYTFIPSIGDLKQTSDRGYIILGLTDQALPNGPPKPCLIKLDNSGGYQWSLKIAGATGGTFASLSGTSVVELLDQSGQCAGYLVACHNSSLTSSNVYDVLVKVSSTGSLLWQKCTDEYDGAYRIQNPLCSAMQSFMSQTNYQSDGYLFTGAGGYAAIGCYIPICKITADGALVSSKGFLNSNALTAPNTWRYSIAYSVQQDFDSSGNPGYIIAGTDGQGSSYSQYVCVIRTDKDGGLTWARKVTSGVLTTYNYAKYASEVFDSTGDPNGYIIGGFTGNGLGLALDGYVLRLDKSGNLKWSRAFANGGTAENFRISPTADRGFIVGNVVGTNSQITKLDDNNNVVMQTKNLVTRASETALCWQETVSATGAADGYIAIGPSTVSAYTYLPHSIFVMKTDIAGNCPEAANPNPVPLTPGTCTAGVPAKANYIIQGTITNRSNYNPSNP